MTLQLKVTIKKLVSLNCQHAAYILGPEDPLEEHMATHSGILPGESLGQKNLAGYSPQGCKESDMTEATQHAHTDISISELL